MHIAYVDDTKQHGQREGMGELVALGAVIFPEEELAPFANDFYAAYEALGVPREVELKWSVPQKKNWFRDNGKLEVQTPLRKRVLEAAALHKAKVIVVIWDLGGGTATAGGQQPEDAVVTFMFERIAIQLEKVEQRGLIVFDKPGGNQRTEEAWLSERHSLTEGGTQYVKSNSIVAPFFTASSHHHPQLQLADLVAGAATAAVAGSEFGSELIPFIQPMFCTNWMGGVGGTGLKLFPDALNNLHYWVNNESSYVRGSTGVSLPWERNGWRYSESAGLGNVD